MIAVCNECTFAWHKVQHNPKHAKLTTWSLFCCLLLWTSNISPLSRWVTIVAQQNYAQYNDNTIHDNVAGIPTDEPAENSLESAAPYDFIELYSGFLPLFYSFGSLSQLLWGHFLQQQAAVFSEKAIKTHCMLNARQRLAGEHSAAFSSLKNQIFPSWVSRN